MKVTVFLSVLLWYTLGTDSLIIPDELPSLLSVIYSNIPTIKKGTDSRIGWGFRLGDRADFQVMVELGPQTNTQPLANQGEGSTSSKRNTLENLANVLYAQNQQAKKLQKEKKLTKKPSTNNGGAEWLKSWSESAKKSAEPALTTISQSIPRIPLDAKPGLGIGEIDAKSVIPEDSEVAAVQEQKKKAGHGTEVEASTVEKEDALDNVDLE